jgi:hypothetical protein
MFKSILGAVQAGQWHIDFWEDSNQKLISAACPQSFNRDLAAWSTLFLRMYTPTTTKKIGKIIKEAELVSID